MKPNTILPFIMLALIAPNSFANDQSTPMNTSNISAKNSQNEQESAIEIILQEHKQIREKIAKIDKILKSDIKESRSLFKELKNFLIKHEAMEQTVWYPELEKYGDLKDIISTLKKEEQNASDEIKRLDSITDDKEWTSKVKKLFKDVEHHAEDEETKLFPKVKKQLDKSQLDKIGTKIKAYENQDQNQDQVQP